jgi:hypothetical protein
MRLKSYFNEFGSSTAITLRLVQNWFHTNRIVIGDSAFASLKTLNALHNNVGGLFFMGMVKTAHTGYPLHYLKEWDETIDKRANRGAHKILQTTISNNSNDNHNIYALGWADKKLKTIISNVGTTLPATPIQRIRSKNVNGITEHFIKEIQCPMMINQFFSCFSAIDIHDHFRQGTLALHEHWKTMKWWHRVFSTILGIIVTDSYLLYKYEYKEFYNGDTTNLVEFVDYIDQLAIEIIQNEFDAPPAGGIRRPLQDITNNSENQVRSNDFIIFFTYLIFSIF